MYAPSGQVDAHLGLLISVASIFGKSPMQEVEHFLIIVSPTVTSSIYAVGLRSLHESTQSFRFAETS